MMQDSNTEKSNWFIQPGLVTLFLAFVLATAVACAESSNVNDVPAEQGPVNTATPTAITGNGSPEASASATPATTRPTATVKPTTTPVPSPTPTPIEPLSVRSITAEVSDNPLIVDITLLLQERMPAYVEYWNADAGHFRSPTNERPSRRQEFALLRLRQETIYRYQAFAENSDGVIVPAGDEGSFQTGKLTNELANLQITTDGEQTTELVLMDLKEQFEDVFLVAFDEDEEIVWYHRNDGARPSSLVQTIDGNFAYIAFKDGIYIINPTGEQLQFLESIEESIIHHDIIQMDDGTFRYLTRESLPTDENARFGQAGRLIEGAGINSWDPETGDVEVLWQWWDFMSPNDTNDLLFATNKKKDIHTNSLNLSPDGNFIVSARHLNQVFLVSSETGEVLWRLGGPESDFRFRDEADQFYHQHQAWQLPDGGVLLFDNGNTRPEDEGGEYSRALRLELDFDRMIARKVWEFRMDPDIYSDAVSGVTPMKNGNVLVTFGRTPELETIPMAIAEVNDEGSAVWTARLTWSPLAPWSYRAYPTSTLAGEIKLEN